MITLANKSAARALAGAAWAVHPELAGVDVFEIEGGSGLWEVRLYFMENPDDIALELLAATQGANPFIISTLPDKDWVSDVRRELAPIRVGRFFLYGAHDADAVPDDRVALLIEASMAFGTGHHSTTQGCLQVLHNLDRHGVRARNVADIGCGTAVLALAAAKIWPGVMLASDIDPVATDVAGANARANGLADRLRILTCAGFDHPDLRAKSAFDLIFANIMKGPLVALAPGMATSIAPGGYAILSGILNGQAEDVKDVYGAWGFSLADHIIVGDWSTLCLRKPGQKECVLRD